MRQDHDRRHASARGRARRAAGIDGRGGRLGAHHPAGRFDQHLPQRRGRQAGRRRPEEGRAAPPPGDRHPGVDGRGRGRRLRAPGRRRHRHGLGNRRARAAARPGAHLRQQFLLPGRPGRVLPARPSRCAAARPTRPAASAGRSPQRSSRADWSSSRAASRPATSISCPAILRDLGVRLAFEQIAVQPGKPTVFGTRGGAIVFGVPGNPVSTFVIFEVFIKPVLFRMMGLAEEPSIVPGDAGARDLLRRRTERAAFVPVRVSGDAVIQVANTTDRPTSTPWAGPTACSTFPRGTRAIPQGAGWMFDSFDREIDLPPHLGHRPLQPALHLLHARRRAWPLRPRSEFLSYEADHRGRARGGRPSASPRSA